jgi:orotidine 5'-phosphate decarboxylase subfamily 1
MPGELSHLRWLEAESIHILREAAAEFERPVVVRDGALIPMEHDFPLAPGDRVDDGKSTLIGRLLYDLRAVYEDELASVRRVSAQGVDLAFITDGLRAEREQGITIDVAYRHFSTPLRRFIIADTPGHEQYTRNMASGASTADVAVILVDVTRGVLPQTLRHAYLSWLLGIRHLCVAVNKMDIAGFDMDRFNVIRAEFEGFAQRLPECRLTFLPSSALHGDNVVGRSDRMPWYQGPTLLHYLETVDPTPADGPSPLRFPIQYVIRSSNGTREYAGQLAGGDMLVDPSGPPLVALSLTAGLVETAGEAPPEARSSPPDSGLPAGQVHLAGWATLDLVSKETRQNPLIIALDVDSAAEARALVERLGDSVDFYKVGMELYAAAGMEFVRELVASEKRVFLDMKFYDIGETVKRAVAQVAKSGVRFLTVHGSGAVMRAAVEGRGDSPLRLLAVTVLTSFDEADLADLGYPCPVRDLVALRVRKAMDAGIDGLVCSPLEAAEVRRLAGPAAILVTPGVRSAGAGKGDQKRVATPAEALDSGANYLVIGRQVTRAPDPRAEVLRISDEIRGHVTMNL